MTADEKSRPEEILSRPVKDRLEYFRGVTVGHPRLIAAYDELLQAIERSGDASVIFVVGPTGIGKTTLLRRTVDELIRRVMTDLEKDPGRLPVLHTEALAPDSHGFKWRDFYRRALESADEPLIDYKKVDPWVLRNRFPERNRYSRVDQQTMELRWALEQTIRHRRPAAILIDEAQHIGKVGSGQKLLDQMDCIKSLASQTGVSHVLFGTYELLHFRNLSGQLSRRSLDVHFARYRADCKEDRQAFMSVIQYFQKRLPLKEEPDLVSMWEFLYEQSVGCVGILKGLINRGLAVALDEDSATLTAKHLERHALSLSRREQIYREICENENEFIEPQGRRNAYRSAIGLKDSVAEKDEQPRSLVKKQYGRVGKRNPIRDPVGRVGNGG